MIFGGTMIFQKPHDGIKYRDVCEEDWVNFKSIIHGQDDATAEFRPTKYGNILIVEYPDGRGLSVARYAWEADGGSRPWWDEGFTGTKEELPPPFGHTRMASPDISLEEIETGLAALGGLK